MIYRDILVEMDGSAAARTRGQLAASLAARFGARLLGAFSKGRIAPPFMPAEALALLTKAEIDRIYAAHEQGVSSAAEQARAVFEAAAGQAGAESDWVVLGDDLQELVDCARRTDLAVVSPEETAGLSAADLVMASGGPVVVAPSLIPDAALGKRVLVAWNGSREAARAVRLAWPFLHDAEAVHVLVVSRGGLGGPEGLLQRHFEQHGVKANLVVDEREDIAAGEALQQQVEALGADLVVMGFYGRSRLRELVLGGVSRRMLKDPKVPLLVCH